MRSCSSWTDHHRSPAAPQRPAAATAMLPAPEGSCRNWSIHVSPLRRALRSCQSSSATPSPHRCRARTRDRGLLPHPGSRQPSIAPGAQWVIFTVAARIEDDNSTRTETWLVPVGGSSPPRRLLHYGRTSRRALTDDDRVAYTADRLEWTMDPRGAAAPPVRTVQPLPGRTWRRGGAAAGSGQLPAGVASPDGAWVAAAVDAPASKSDPKPVSDFERRHDDASRARFSTGRTSSETASPSRRRTCAPAGGAHHHHADGGWRRPDADDTRSPAVGPDLAPRQLQARVHRRPGLARRAEVREPGPLGSERRRRCGAAHG